MKGSAVVDAFESERKANSGNYFTDGQSLFLFGNKIATHTTGGIIFTLAGYQTTTTVKALNWISGVSVHSRKGFVYQNETLINAQDWFNKEGVKVSQEVVL